MIQHKINFSPTKTKCLCFGPNKDFIKKIKVAGSEIEWSKHAVHLGITLSEDGTMEQDGKVKRAISIDGCHDLEQLETGSELKVEELQAKINSICDRLSFAELPEEESWRIEAAKEVSLIKSKHLYVEGFDNAGLEEILRFICTS